MEYTDLEIQDELSRLGYTNVSDDQLKIFKLHLMKLIHSERDKKSQNNHVNSQEAYGNISNHGNQWLDNTTNYNADWVYDDVSKSYSNRGKDFGDISSMEGTYGENYNHPDVGSDSRVVSFSSDLHTTNLRTASSEPSVKPKSVKWNLTREQTKVTHADDGRHDRPEIRDNNLPTTFSPWHFSSAPDLPTVRPQGRAEKDDKQSVHSDRREIQRQASEDIESYEGYKGFPRKIPGIITRKEHPHTRNLVRTKPFERHQMYMREWKARPPVGEASRSSVCREVHKKLLKREEIVKVPSKTLTPNQYVVPTDKPRYELRWAVRQCNENFEMPPCGFFHES